MLLSDKSILTQEDALRYFWHIRAEQKTRAKGDGNRAAVVGGRQMDSFLALLKNTALEVGVPEACIHLRKTTIPGYYRATKQWDLVIVTPNHRLVAAVELKSQVGSLGNNFNNRVEESIGSATDLWTAYRESTFPPQPAPWLGFFLVVGVSESLERTVQTTSEHFPVRKEFEGTSYRQRYELFMRKMLQERLYSSAALLFASPNGEVDSPAYLTFADFQLSFTHQLALFQKDFQ